MWRCSVALVVAVFLAVSAKAAEPSSELHFYNWAFSDLGTTQLGGRIDWRHVEITVENRGGLSVSLGVYESFNQDGFFVPRLALAVQLYGTTGLLSHSLTGLAGMGVGFPLFKLWGGKVGVGWDYYVYIMKVAGKVLVQPFVPLTLSYYF